MINGPGLRAEPLKAPRGCCGFNRVVADLGIEEKCLSLAGFWNKIVAYSLQQNKARQRCPLAPVYNKSQVSIRIMVQTYLPPFDKIISTWTRDHREPRSFRDWSKADFVNLQISPKASFCSLVLIIESLLEWWVVEQAGRWDGPWQCVSRRISKYDLKKAPLSPAPKEALELEGCSSSGKDKLQQEQKAIPNPSKSSRLLDNTLTKNS